MLVKKIRKRGVRSLVVEAHAEILFAPTGDIGEWKRRVSRKVAGAASRFAPSNERPRWAHYGQPLKQTMTATTSYQPKRMRVYSAVGSKADYAYYVDQGTGIHAGRAPWAAKILPPRTQGGHDLWEPRKGRPDKMIKGQRGQQFMQRGLDSAFRSMRIYTRKVPGNGGIGALMAGVPSGLYDGFTGNTPADAAFRAQREEWRQWRKDAWGDEDFRERQRLNRPSRAMPAHLKAERKALNKAWRADQSAKRSRKWREDIKSGKHKPKRKKPTRAQEWAAESRALTKAKATAKVKAGLNDGGYDFKALTINSNGTWTAMVRRRGTSGIFRTVKGKW